MYCIVLAVCVSSLCCSVMLWMLWSTCHALEARDILLLQKGYDHIGLQAIANLNTTPNSPAHVIDAMPFHCMRLWPLRL